MDDILFGSTNKKMCDDFSRKMSEEFEMSMMGELCFFLGFEIKQLNEGTFLNQSKFTRDLVKKFSLEGAKSMNTPMSPSTSLDKDHHIEQLGFCKDCIVGKAHRVKFNLCASHKTKGILDYVHTDL